MKILLCVLACINALGVIAFPVMPSAAVGCAGAAVVCGFMAAVLDRLDRLIDAAHRGDSSGDKSAVHYPLKV